MFDMPIVLLSLIQRVSLEHLLCVGLYARLQGYKNEYMQKMKICWEKWMDRCLLIFSRMQHMK